MALLGALVLVAQDAQAVPSPKCDGMERGCGPCNRPKPRPRANMQEANQMSCDDAMRACPCSKPKPKPPVAPRSNAAEELSCDAMRACPCSKPKPKPPVKPTTNMQMVESFRCASPMQQRSMLAMQVEDYMDNPCDEMACMLMCCAEAYCERMQNQEMNMMVKELMCSDCKEEVQERIMQALGF